MNILGFSGKAYSGKDTAANMALQRLIELGFGVYPLHMANPLKEAVAAIFDLSPEQLHGSKKAETDIFWGRTPRQILQLMGTESVRDIFGQDTWCKAIERRIRRLIEVHKRPVEPWFTIADIRFPNEAEMVHRLGGKVIRCHCGPSRLEGPAALHASEVALDEYEGFDFLLDNTGTLDHLRVQVLKVIERLVCFAVL
jgi:hypothetical protein